MGRISRWLLIFLLCGSVVGATTPPAHAITFCFDYVLYRVTGEDHDRTDADGLVEALKQHGYHPDPFPLTQAADDPNVMAHLQPGDVVFVGHAHVGIVSGSGIDHFIQVYGASGTRYDPLHLPSTGEGKAGGLFRGDDLRTFLGRRFQQSREAVLVYRRTPGSDSAGSVEGAWMFHWINGKDHGEFLAILRDGVTRNDKGAVVGSYRLEGSTLIMDWQQVSNHDILAIGAGGLSLKGTNQYHVQIWAEKGSPHPR